MRPRRAWSTAAWITGLTAIAAAQALVLVTLLSPGDLPVASNVAQLVTVPLSSFPLLVALVLWRRRTRRSIPVTPARLAEARGQLAVAVGQRWDEEARLRGLLPDPIPISWRVTHRDGLQHHTSAITTGSLLLFTDGHDIAQLAHDFRHRLTHQRLVLLGEAGTGKSSLAILLLRELLASRDDDAPVPVLLTAASWNPREHTDFHDWLASELADDYPSLQAPELGENIARDLVTGGHILPILDGLDELDPAAQPVLLDLLNQSLGPLILTSRTTEFDTAIHAARQVLAAALVLEPAILTPNTIGTYLTGLPVRGHPDWHPILAALRAEDLAAPTTTALAGLADTALGLWLLRSVYFTPRFDPAGHAADLPSPAPLLAQNSVEAMRAHLLDQLIGAAIAAWPPHTSQNDHPDTTPRRTYDPGQAEQWLRYLADHLTSRATRAHGVRSVTDLAWWRLADDTQAITRPVRVLPAALGLLITFMLCLNTQGWSDRNGWIFVLVILVSWGPMGEYAWTQVERWSQHRPGFAELRPSRKPPGATRLLIVRSISMIGLAFATPYALFYSVEIVEFVIRGFSLPEPPLIGWAVGVSCVLTFGIPAVLAVGVPPWLETTSEQHTASTPQRSWRADRTLNLSHLLLSLSAGVSWLVINATLISTQESGSAEEQYLTADMWWLAAWAFALMLFTLTALYGRHHAWLAYVIATVQLARRRHLPRDLMSFLDDMHRIGLLRAVGPAYQFRHDALRVHLASAPPLTTR